MTADPQYLLPFTQAGGATDWDRSNPATAYEDLVGEEHNATPSTYDSSWIKARMYFGGGIPTIFTSSPMIFSLDVFTGSIAAPAVNSGHVLWIRLKRIWDDALATDPGGTQALNVTLLQGSTPIYSKPFSLTSTNPGATWTTYSSQIPSNVASLIDDYDDLWISITPSWNGVGAGISTFDLGLMVSHVELEIPGQTKFIRPDGISDAAMGTPIVGHGISLTGLDSDEAFGLHSVAPAGAIVVAGMDTAGEFGAAFVSESNQTIYAGGMTWPRLRSEHRVYAFPNSEPLELTLRAQAIGNKTLRVKSDPFLFNSLME